MNYKRRRKKAGISFYTMAKELGIDEKKYKEVELGLRPLEGKMIDKFFNIIGKQNAKEITFNRDVKINEINEWLTSGKAVEKMREMGYKQGELANEIKCAQATISAAFNKNSGKPVSNDIKEKIYDFLNDPLNKKIVPLQRIKTEIKGDKDLKARLKKLNITQIELAKAIGHDTSNITHLIRGDKNVSDSIKNKVYSYLEKAEKEITKEEVIVAQPDESKRLPAEEVNEVNILKAKIEMQSDLIKKLEKQVALYEKLIERL